MNYQIRSVFSVVIDFIMALIAFFLGMRVIFELFRANAATPFVAWIYGVSGSLMYPFANLFPNIELPGLGFLDLVALLTLLAYSILGYLVLGVIRAALPVREYVEHQHVV